MIGPVQLNETRANVKAMKKMLRRPDAVSAFESTDVLHLDGSLMSKAPKNEMANTTSRAKKMRLNTALVLKSFNLLAPNITVISRPSTR